MSRFDKSLVRFYNYAPLLKGTAVLYEGSQIGQIEKVSTTHGTRWQPYDSNIFSPKKIGSPVASRMSAAEVLFDR